MPQPSLPVETAVDPTTAMILRAFAASGSPGLAGASPQAQQQVFGDIPPGGPASILDRLGALAAFFGNALPMRGGLVAPGGGGTVRLYRGDGPRVPPDKAVWKDPEMLKYQGRWFTTNRALAESHARDMWGSKAHVVEVDVPADIASASLVRGKPDLERLSYGAPLDDTFVLPPDWASKAR